MDIDRYIDAGGDVYDISESEIDRVLGSSNELRHHHQRRKSLGSKRISDDLRRQLYESWGVNALDQVPTPPPEYSYWGLNAPTPKVTPSRARDELFYPDGSLRIIDDQRGLFSL